MPFWAWSPTRAASDERISPNQGIRSMAHTQKNLFGETQTRSHLIKIHEDMFLFYVHSEGLGSPDTAVELYTSAIPMFSR